MLLAAALLTAALVALAVVVPPRLARAQWPLRGPVPALVLWQAVGLTAGLLLLELAVTLALVPYGRDHADALAHLGVASVSPAARVASLVPAAVGLLVALRLLQVLARSAGRTLVARRRHRELVDLVATRNPLLHGVDVVGHDLPVAYCLPGLRPRVVVSSGALTRLSRAEVDAVLAHEQAHVVQRHDLVVLPFLALGATFPALAAVRTASDEVALLVEVLADDRASRAHDRTALARALYKVGSGQVPSGGLGAGGAGSAVLVRARRLLEPPAPLSLPETAAALLAALAVLLLPALGLLVPVL